MKCKYCKYMNSLSTENGTYYWCDFFDDGDPEEFATENGCNLRPKEAEKLFKLQEQCDPEDYNSYFDELSRRHKKYCRQR